MSKMIILTTLLPWTNNIQCAVYTCANFSTWRIWPFSELDVIWLPFQDNTDAIESLHSESPLTFKLDHSPDTNPLREIIWELAYKHLKRNDWKKLAEFWEFTEDQVAAIEEQWTGQSEMLYHQIFYIILSLCSEEPQNKPPNREFSSTNRQS